MIQEIKAGFSANGDRILPVYKRSMARALNVETPETLAPVHIYNRVGPKLPEKAIFTPPSENNDIYLKAAREYETWFIARVVGSNGVKQIVPGFGGFVSATGVKPTRKSTIEYLTPIHEPFAEYSVVKELLRRSKKSTSEVGQEYVVTTFDLGGCMKALPLIWKYPEEYGKHVVIPGPFHTGMNYINMVTGNKCRGSGYSDILIEAGLVISGSLKSVLKGKAYYPDSIKNQERMRRGCSQKYIVDGPATRKPVDFKLFLANAENKTQLCQLLLRVWGSQAAASRLEKSGRAVVVVDGKAYDLMTSDDRVTMNEVYELRSNQEETDTCVVVYLAFAAQMGYQSAVVRTPDTDILLILLHHAFTLPINIYLDIGTGKHRKIINVTELAESKGAEYCTALLGLYVYTGEDATSAFKGKGKILPLKKLHKNHKFNTTFRRLGDEWSVEGQIIDELEAFTCLMYGFAREKSVNSVRTLMLKKMVGEDAQMTLKSKVNLSRLPPCRNNLILHIQRVNHRLACYKRANQALFWQSKPHDLGQGWEKTEEGYIEPIWCDGPILPPSLVDIIEATNEEVEESDTDEEKYDEEVDFDELFSDDDYD